MSMLLQSRELVFLSLITTQDRLLELERPIARDARILDLDQHWIDFAGRKLNRSDTTKAGRKKLMGAMEMGDTPLTEASSRALMAGYADSAASKVRLELGGRIDAVEPSVGALFTQVRIVDNNMDPHHKLNGWWRPLVPKGLYIGKSVRTSLSRKNFNAR